MGELGGYPSTGPDHGGARVSGGLEEVIRGSSIAKHLNGIWGCQFAEEDGQIRYLKNIVSFGLIHRKDEVPVPDQYGPRR
jgi:hypothetical protein